MEVRFIVLLFMSHDLLLALLLAAASWLLLIDIYVIRRRRPLATVTSLLSSIYMRQIHFVLREDGMRPGQT